MKNNIYVSNSLQSDNLFYPTSACRTHTPCWLNPTPEPCFGPERHHTFFFCRIRVCTWCFQEILSIGLNLVWPHCTIHLEKANPSRPESSDSDPESPIHRPSSERIWWASRLARIWFTSRRLTLKSWAMEMEVGKLG